MAAGAAFPSLSSVKCWMGNASVGYVPGPPGFPFTSERNQRRPAQAPPCDQKISYTIQGKSTRKKNKTFFIRVVRLEQTGSSYNFGDYKQKSIFPLL